MTAFLLAVGLVLLAAVGGGRLAATAGLPRVVGEIGAGIVLGHSLLGQVWPEAERYLFGPDTSDALRKLGLLVVVVYIALTGTRLDGTRLRRWSPRIVVSAALGLLLAGAGAGIIGAALPELRPPGVSRGESLLFVTGALLVTAVPVLVRILDETATTTTRLGTATLTLSVADDLVAFSLIAVVAASATGESVALAVAGTLALVAVPIAARAAVGAARHRPAPLSPVAIGLLAIVAAGSEWLGASVIVAAFIVGACLLRPARSSSQEPAGELVARLVPIYIVSATLPVDLTRLAEPRLLVATLLVTAVALASKATASAVAARLLALSGREARGLVVLRNTRGLTELVALNVGLQAGLLDQDLYTVFVVMALVTTAITGALALRTLPAQPAVPEPRAEPLPAPAR